MDFLKIDLNKISLKKNNESFTLKYNEKQLEFYTVKLKCPYGIEKKYNNFFINFVCDNNELEKFILDFEKYIEKLINNIENSNYKINSQINKNTKMLYTKLLSKNSKIIIDFKTLNNEYLNIYKLDKSKYYYCKLLIDNFYIKNNIIYYKFKIKSMIL